MAEEHKQESPAKAKGVSDEAKKGPPIIRVDRVLAAMRELARRKRP